MTHLEFMGIPLKGSSKDFLSELRRTAKIYSVEKEEDGKVECSISFTDKYALVVIYGDPVYCIEVKFLYGGGYTGKVGPTEEEWNEMVSDFNEYKEALTRKYGYPSSVETQLERKIHISYLDRSLYGPDYVPPKSKYISDDEGLSCSARFNITGGHISIFTTIHGYTYYPKKTALVISYTDEFNEEYNRTHPKSYNKPLDKKYNDL